MVMRCEGAPVTIFLLSPPVKLLGAITRSFAKLLFFLEPSTVTRLPLTVFSTLSLAIVFRLSSVIIELPFKDTLDYSGFSVFVHSSEAVKKGFLVNLLRGVTEDQWKKKWERLKEVARCFEYRFPSQPGDSVDMIWSAVSHKLASLQFDVHRKNRYRRSEVFKRSLST